MKISGETSLRDLAFIVCTALNQSKVTAVLTGGGAATIWSNEGFQSRDCDFIITFCVNNKDYIETLNGLGFYLKNHSFIHPESQFYIEFPRGPLSIGDDQDIKWATLTRQDDQILHILSSTDSCRDRLAAFYHWNDYSSLSAAVAVAAVQQDSIDFRLIEQWSMREGVSEKYKQFTHLLNERLLDNTHS